VSTAAGTIRSGIAWNATHVAGVLMIVIIAAIALVFWPSFEPTDTADPSGWRPAHAIAPAEAPIVVNGQPCPQCLP
jgi:hypothetical protein